MSDFDKRKKRKKRKYEEDGKIQGGKSQKSHTYRYTKERMEAINEYNKANYQRISLSVPASSKALMQIGADIHGMSLSAYLQKLADDDLQQHMSEVEKNQKKLSEYRSALMGCGKDENRKTTMQSAEGVRKIIVSSFKDGSVIDEINLDDDDKN